MSNYLFDDVETAKQQQERPVHLYLEFGLTVINNFVLFYRRSLKKPPI